MLDKFLLAIFVANFGFISILSSKAIAQERPKCYLIDESGELTDLSDICDVSQRETSASTTNEGENVVNNNINIVNSDSASTRSELISNEGFVVSADNSSSSSGAIDSSYLIDNEPGIDYTAYVRRYKSSPDSFDRLTSREQIFGFDDRNRSHTSILRRGRSELPFLIYRYQN